MTVSSFPSTDVSTREQWMDYYEHFGTNPNLRDLRRVEPCYELAERFADLWDQKAFDASYEAESLEHFEPTVNNVFARAHSI
ncbi:MAG: metal dependent phosphohydrolase [Acidimicrobiaceae bacterium]|nr:metal dependent phosphohydrolase [Acidimicrobiaceae bacterium]